jgi:hypothetical protein
MLAPWLSYLLSEITLPGGGGIKFRELTQEVQRLRGDVAGGVDSAQRTIDAKIAAIEAEILAIKSAGTKPMKSTNDATSQDAKSQIETLAQEYEQIRTSMQSGPERTAQMTRIIGQMIAMIQKSAGLDLSDYLTDDRRGRRLAGYAYQYVRPDPEQLTTLALNIVEDNRRPPEKADKPFGQYWALRALRKVYEEARNFDNDLDRNTFRRLQGYLQSISASSDRAYELRRILDEYSAKISPPT